MHPTPDLESAIRDLDRHVSRDGWTERRVDELFFRKLQDNHFPLEGLITHEFSPTECTQAYDLAERERQQVMGILFDWTAGAPPCP